AQAGQEVRPEALAALAPAAEVVAVVGLRAPEAAAAVGAEAAARDRPAGLHAGQLLAELPRQALHAHGVDERVRREERAEQVDRPVRGGRGLFGPLAGEEVAADEAAGRAVAQPERGAEAGAGAAVVLE